MARLEDRKKAINLRKKGKTYSEIRSLLGVSKGALSSWLKDYPLSKEQMREVRDFNQKRIEHYRETRRKTRERRFLETYKVQEQKILPMLRKNLFLEGLFLCWGEGLKTSRGEVGISNTDPSAIIFFITWITTYFDVPKNKLKARLHLYSDMDIKKETFFWSKKIGIPKNHFRKPYIKQSLQSKVVYYNRFTHGTCNVIIGNARLTEEIKASLEVIRNRFS